MGWNHWTGLITVTLLVTACTASDSPGPVESSDPADLTEPSLDSYLERMVPFGFSGSVLVARGGDVIVERGYGWADESAEIPNSPQTRFPIESISKQFTAAAVVRLASQGRLDLDASIADYLPGVPPDKAGITPHHLLTHTSGIMTGTDEYLEGNGRDEILATAFARPLLFEPGQRDAYSNIGYALLAAIVERVTGEGFNAHLRDTIFAAADLRHTGFAEPSVKTDSVARRYADGIDRGSPADDSPDDWNHVGSSGVLSTPRDLYRWHEALLTEEPLSAEAKERMYTPIANGYGYGWYIADTEHGRRVEHDGGSSRGSGGDFVRYLDENVTIIVLSNRDSSAMLFGERLMEAITELTFGATVTPPPEVVASVIPAGEYAGTYRFADGAAIEVSEVGSLLELRGTGQRSVEGLLALSPTEASAYQRANQRTASLLSAVVDGDLSTLAGAASESLREQLPEMFAAMSGALGKPTGFEVLGTVPPTGVGTADSMTLFTIDYPRQPSTSRFYWRDEEIIALGGGGLSKPVRVRAVTTERDEFLGYHVATARSVALSFERDAQSQVVGIKFSDPLGTAARVDGPSF